MVYCSGHQIILQICYSRNFLLHCRIISYLFEYIFINLTSIYPFIKWFFFARLGLNCSLYVFLNGFVRCGRCLWFLGFWLFKASNVCGLINRFHWFLRFGLFNITQLKIVSIIRHLIPHLSSCLCFCFLWFFLNALK